MVDINENPITEYPSYEECVLIDYFIYVNQIVLENTTWDFLRLNHNIILAVVGPSSLRNFSLFNSNFVFIGIWLNHSKLVTDVEISRININYTQ